MAPKKDLLTRVMDENIKKISKKNERSSTIKEGKVAEQYFTYLEKHQSELQKDKVSVMMQVGSFYEVYGYIKPNGDKVGNIWKLAEEADLAVSPKKMLVFNNPENQLYMAGVKEEICK